VQLRYEAPFSWVERARGIAPHRNAFNAAACLWAQAAARDVPAAWLLYRARLPPRPDFCIHRPHGETLGPVLG